MAPMKHKFWSGAAALVLIFGMQFAAAQDKDSKAAKTRADIDTDAAAIIAEFKHMKGGQALFDKAAGYAVFRVTKAGLGASGAGGGGVAVDKKTGDRTYMRMGSAGVGFTFGVSRYDIVILFQTAKKFAAFKQGGSPQPRLRRQPAPRAKRFRRRFSMASLTSRSANAA